MKTVFIMLSNVAFYGSSVESVHSNFESALKAARAGAEERANLWNMDLSEITTNVSGNAFHLDDYDWIVIEREVQE